MFLSNLFKGLEIAALGALFILFFFLLGALLISIWPITLITLIIGVIISIVATCKGVELDDLL